MASDTAERLGEPRGGVPLATWLRFLGGLIPFEPLPEDG